MHFSNSRILLIAVVIHSLGIHCTLGFLRSPDSEPAKATVQSRGHPILTDFNLDAEDIPRLVKRSKRSPQSDSDSDIVENNGTSTETSDTDSDTSSNSSSTDPFDLGPPPPDNPAYTKHMEEYHERLKTGDAYLPKRYSKYELPRLSIARFEGVIDLPVPAEILINLRSILDIDEENERILMDMDYIINWLDGKIMNHEYMHQVHNPEFVSMPQIFLDKIWVPDIYLDNLVELNKLKFMHAPIAVAMDPLSGVIQYRQRLAPNVMCGMDFHYYPADTQVCQFSLRSYAYGEEDMKISWAKPVALILQDRTDANFELRVDDLEHLILPEEVHHGTNNSYYVLRFKLFAKRKLSYHLLQTYIPSVFFVIITWLCFLLPSAMVEARIGITMTTLLTLTAMFSAVRESTPIVSYAKAIDIWMSVCILFIFLTLFEFTFMVWINYYREQREKLRMHSVELYLDESSPTTRARAQTLAQKMEKMNSVVSISSAKLRRLEAGAAIVERFALPLYSISFLGFAVAYWVWLLNAADYLNWEVNPKYNKISEEQ